MARNFKLLGILGLLLSVGTTAGCGSNTGMVANLTQPSFAGPMITGLPSPQVVAPTRFAPPTVGRGPTAPDRAWIPNANAAPRPWKWIVIHHSATPSGSAAIFDKMHREKGWDELGYHFVIGNGTNSGDGQVEVGSRWPVQKWGAHAKTPDQQFNQFGIGICLVGNFDIERPTPQQMQSLAKLVAYMMQTYHIPASHVIGHQQTGKATDCPGRNMNVAVVQRMATQMIADAGGKVEDPDEITAQTAGANELLNEVPQASARHNP